MISVKRWAAAGIPFVYLLYLPVQSILIPGFLNRSIEIIALGLYLAAGVPTFLLFKGIRIPLWQAAINLVIALLLPFLVITERHLSHSDAIGGWMVMGTTVLLTATAVRQHPWLAIIGLVSLITQVLIEYGPPGIISYGLVGAIVFVLAGLGVSSGIRRANRESDKYRDQQVQSLANIAAIEAAQTARQERLQEVLSSAIPMLQVISQSTTPLDKQTKEESKLLELALRDEIRGKGLLTQVVRQEVSRLRKLGCEVALLDEGGLDGLEREQREILLKQAVEALRGVSAGRVTLRSPKNETYSLTVVATIPGQAAPLVNLKL